MPISFGKKNKSAETRLPESSICEAFRPGADPLPENLSPVGHLSNQKQVRLIDLRSPDAFREGFIPGSYSVPDLRCLMAGRRSGLFAGRATYLLADTPEQLQLFSASEFLGIDTEVAGWFGADAIQEWQKLNPRLGSFESIDSEVLAIKIASDNLLVLDIQCEDETRPISHPSALRFRLEDIPLTLDGLPAESPICLTSCFAGVSSFAASLLWNFGFHNICCLGSGVMLPQRVRD